MRKRILMFGILFYLCVIVMARAEKPYVILGVETTLPSAKKIIIRDIFASRGCDITVGVTTWTHVATGKQWNVAVMFRGQLYRFTDAEIQKLKDMIADATQVEVMASDNPLKELADLGMTQNP